MIDEVLEAVAAAADRDPLPVRHGVRDDPGDLPRRVDHVHDVEVAAKRALKPLATDFRTGGRRHRRR
ncbi:hypothetical protein QMZ92_17670 [Streptomyces sp. HNM0645]|uniref:hypothetical protein n=1 Tax=Streptomyces sp. HNM0645 TaxID=2782343 RepID=UPI0024B7BC72|nr:hypothetical protein [Streptomyces sp. HNM0645]MDI9886157.1 hypothetical protein [Streptomyces sp. HNM0645]